MRRAFRAVLPSEMSERQQAASCFPPPSTSQLRLGINTLVRHARSICNAPLEEAAKVQIIPQIRLTALIFTIGPPVSRITLIPSSFYLSNSLSSLRRYEAGNKTLGLKGSSQALPPLDCLPPLLPPNPTTTTTTSSFSTHPCCSAYLPHIQFNSDCD